MARILVVDDERDVRRFVRVALEMDGHHVVEAEGGAEALELLAAEPFDLVVLDVSMPGLEGWEVLRRIKAEPGPVREVPVIMLTALAGDLDRIRGGIEGAVRYLLKPFSPDVLCHEVARAAQGEPEAVQRRRAQHRALEELARLEAGGAPGDAGGRPRPRLTRLGPAVEAAPPPAARPRLAAHQLALLSPKQQQLLHAVATAPTVLAAAEQLEVSRSNVYGSLRRIARRLGAASVPELVALVRDGGIADPPG